MRKSIFGFGIGCLMSLMLCIPVRAEIPTDKTPTVGTWQEIDGNWYFIGEDGNKKTGWIVQDNNWYYCDDATGEMLSNEVTPEGYYIRPDGTWNGKRTLKIIEKMTQSPEYRTFGWHYMDEASSKRAKYFVKQDGSILVDMWACINGEYCYFSEQGYLQKNSFTSDGFLTINGQWDGKPSRNNPTLKKPEVLPENIITTVESNAEQKHVNAGIIPVAGNSGSYKSEKGWIEEKGRLKYINSNYTYSLNGWDIINNKWYYFDEEGYALVNQWVGDYYVGEDGAMLMDAVTPDGVRVGEDGVREGVYTAQSSSSGSDTNVSVDIPNYATYLADGTQALSPFVLVGFVNKGNDPITVYQKNAFFKGSSDVADMFCISMKHYINENESEICTSYTISPKGSAMIIFYLNDSGATYDANSLLQFGIEYNGKGYLCKVTTGTTECVPVESAGMSLDMFK